MSPTTAASGDTGGDRAEAAAQHYRRIRQDILDGAFPAGTVLHETALTERYGVSRTPIREALARLEHDGLLDRAARGYRVRSGTPEDVLDIYEARIALEAVAAANAATRATELELARLEGLHAEAGATADLAAVRRLHSAWHQELWAAAHNATVLSLLTRLTAQLRIYDSHRSEDPTDLEQSHAEHEQIMAALRSRDAAAARSDIGAHLDRSRDLRLRAFAAHLSEV